jgi:hypothetical protein
VTAGVAGGTNISAIGPRAYFGKSLRLLRWQA